MSPTPDRWQKIEALYHAAAERDQADRMAYLDGACGGDDELRREVESLLAEDASREGMLDHPVSPLPLDETQLSAGLQLGPYKMETPIGKGGMGEVWKARDTRLHRAVAIKRSAQQFTDRFEREARVVAALNHPHICHLYDVGPNYLVMEFIDGSPLKGPLPVDRVLKYAEEICDALNAAHTRGVVHRDLKPANILISKQGIKLLDFGIAQMQPGPDDTTMAQMTQTGAMIGTPAYMAPEQREGKPVDARSDIYSFGCVLYEMLTGERASGRVGAALQLRVAVPPELERILFKCLEYEPELRYQHASDIRADLLRLQRDTESARATARATPVSSLPVAPPIARWRGKVVAAGTVAAALAAGSFFLFRPLHGAPKLTDHDTIVVADFDNKTGDPAFDDTLRQGLIVQLQQSPYLSLVPDQKVRSTLKLMGKPADRSPGGDTAREVCQRVGARALLTGSIATLGSKYVISLRAEGCANGETLDSQQEEAGGKDQVLKTLGEMAGKFRAHAGESLAALREHNVPLEEATTSSLEALKAYTEGIALSGNRYDEAALQLKRATELDPQFAVAWSLLAIDYSSSGETALARESAIRAYEARERASGPEKFNVEYSYYRNATGNLEKAWDAISLWRQTYPRDVKAFSLSGGYAANGTGRFEQGLEASVQAIAIDPFHLPSYDNQAQCLFHLNRFADAEKAFAIAVEHKALPGDGMVTRYRLALMKQDKAGIERLLAERNGDSETEMVLAPVQALAAARDGRIGEADRQSRRGIEMARSAGRTERAAVLQASQAVWHAFYGNRDAARQEAEIALKTFDGREVDYAAGFALGLAGDGARAEALAARLDKGHPEDTQVQATYVPTLRALAALDRNDPLKAIDLLEANRRYEFGIPPLAFNHFFGNMYPLYVRGVAYLALHRNEEATQEFSRLLAHPGLATGDPVESVARRQLALALAPGGKAKAEAAYKDILAMWKNADPDFAILKQTKAEYARLR